MVAKSDAAKAKLKANQKAYAKSPRGKWSQQRAQAKERGVEFHLTFEEWYSLWETSGRYQQRGRGPEDYCMSRLNDSGAYEVGNVEITTVEANLKVQLGSGKHSTKVLTLADHCAIFELSDKGLTQREIAVKLGVGQPYISRVLSGLRGRLSKE